MNLPAYYPNSAKVNAKNHLEIGDYDLVELADRFGSPLYVLDEKTIRDTAREYKQALDEFYPNNLPIFASKALALKAVFAILQEEGFGLDVVSAGELFTAESINFPADKIYLHGNNKSIDELERAVNYAGTKVIIDNFHDIKLLGQLNKPIDCLLRLTPGIECHTHDYIKTGQIDSKFGFDLEHLIEAIERIKETNNINLIGLHAHIGSQIFEVNPYEDVARILLENFVKLNEKYNLKFQELNIGGGIGINYTTADDPPNIREVMQVLSHKVKSLINEFKLETPKLIVEPGRSIVGRAGVTVYEIGSSKIVPKGRHYIAVNGGMADNPRPITYQAKYSACVANKANLANNQVYTIAGRYCESGDILIKDIELPADLEPKDLIVLFGTGAYNYSMSSNYNRVPKPAMVLVQNGEAEIILQRESLEDLIKNVTLPSRLIK